MVALFTLFKEAIISRKVYKFAPGFVIPEFYDGRHNAQFYIALFSRASYFAMGKYALFQMAPHAFLFHCVAIDSAHIIFYGKSWEHRKEILLEQRNVLSPWHKNSLINSFFQRNDEIIWQESLLRFNSFYDMKTLRYPDNISRDKFRS